MATNQKLNHTPGPWKVTMTGIKDSNGLLIAQAWCGDTNDSFGNHPSVGYLNMIANAHLIAAAPDLLDALKDCVDVFNKPTHLQLKALKNAEVTLAQFTGTTIRYRHVLKFVRDGAVVKREVITTVERPDLYWEKIIDNALKNDHGYCLTGKYQIVAKCIDQSPYHYSINELEVI